jgi:DNA-binding LacI/PurR family transcriptional regulator
LIRDGMPCIVIRDGPDDPGPRCVGFEGFKATYAATEYLS